MLMCFEGAKLLNAYGHFIANRTISRMKFYSSEVQLPRGSHSIQMDMQISSNNKLRGLRPQNEIHNSSHDVQEG